MSWSSPASADFLPGNFTVSTLPDPVAMAKRYAWVTDLHDGQPDRVISDGVAWKPVRPFAATVIANATGARTFTPLMNAPTQILRGALAAAVTNTLSETYAFSGAKFRIKREASGLVSMLVKNTAGTLIATLGSSTWADFEWVSGQGWVQTASGGLI